MRTNELAETKLQTGDNLQVINMWFDKEIRRAHGKLEVAEYRYFTLYLMLKKRCTDLCISQICLTAIPLAHGVYQYVILMFVFNFLFYARRELLVISTSKKSYSFYTQVYSY
jgi:hypothetical protein